MVALEGEEGRGRTGRPGLCCVMQVQRYFICRSVPRLSPHSIWDGGWDRLLPIFGGTIFCGLGYHSRGFKCCVTSRVWSGHDVSSWQSPSSDAGHRGHLQLPACFITAYPGSERNWRRHAPRPSETGRSKNNMATARNHWLDRAGPSAAGLEWQSSDDVSPKPLAKRAIKPTGSSGGKVM